jgi:hypothetical protein
MSVYYKPRVSEQGVMAGGAGPAYTLPGTAAPGGYKLFSTLTTATDYEVLILDSVTFAWELSRFTFTAPETLTRVAFHDSSTGSAVTFSSSNIMLISVDHPEAVPDSTVAYAGALVSLSDNLLIDPSLLPAAGALAGLHVTAASVTLTAADYGKLIVCSGASTPFTVTLPPPVVGKTIYFTNVTNGNVVFTTPSGSIWGSLTGPVAVTSVTTPEASTGYFVSDGAWWYLTFTPPYPLQPSLGGTGTTQATAPLASLGSLQGTTITFSANISLTPAQAGVLIQLNGASAFGCNLPNPAAAGNTGLTYYFFVNGTVAPALSSGAGGLFQGPNGNGLNFLYLQPQTFAQAISNGANWIVTAFNAGTAGITDGSNAPAGYIGEVLAASASVGIANSTLTNIATFILTPGDWDVTGVGQLLGSAANMGDALIGIATASAGTPAADFGSRITFGAGPLMANYEAAVPTKRFNVTASAPIQLWLVAYASISTGTVTVTGTIRARRVR